MFEFTHLVPNLEWFQHYGKAFLSLKENVSWALTSWFPVTRDWVTSKGLKWFPWGSSCHCPFKRSALDQFRPSSWFENQPSCSAMLQESLRAMTELRNNETPKGEIKKSGKSKSAKWIKPLAENFKRTLKGQALVRQEVRKLLQQQTHSFPLKSMVDAEGTTVRYGVEGEVRGIALDSLLHKAPYFFSYYFRDVRKKLDYGARVQRWLCSVTCLASFL